MTSDNIVSFDDEKLIIVDENDSILGYRTKAECHQGDGILHRAFSIFIFNDQKQLLLQKRSSQKLLWPGYWSNSCCSHPRQGETLDLSASRRLKEELGLAAELIYLYTFQYHARFGTVGSERELCAVLIGHCNDPVRINPNEIAEWKYVDINMLGAELERHPEKYTPWFKMEWQRLMREFIHDIDGIFRHAAK